jgi:hypothetical protein
MAPETVTADRDTELTTSVTRRVGSALATVATNKSVASANLLEKHVKEPMAPPVVVEGPEVMALMMRNENSTALPGRNENHLDHLAARRVVPGQPVVREDGRRPAAPVSVARNSAVAAAVARQVVRRRKEGVE